MKGIILAGGKATRLYPVTKGVCKQLLPVYDKPLIYYPLSVLMLAGIRDILIISTPKDISNFQYLFDHGRQLGLHISYRIQPEPKGIAQALLIGEEFIGTDQVALILGDNIFYGDKLGEVLRQAMTYKDGATIFGYKVTDPQRYGVISFNKRGQPVAIIEKPSNPPSDWAVTGLYFYDCRAVHIAKKLKPSTRGELEITDLNQYYLKEKKLKVKLLSRGFAWLDTGTHDSLMDASLFIKIIEERQGLKIGCIEEIAFRMGFITRQNLLKLSSSVNTTYGFYLKRIAGYEK
ncbi:MAG: glucose-1-phosphate thymidylyltransferase RfbA [Candidatus Omnitrophica bacterium]|nr:glucose-1-phosphate thymidylyltransferase RfbA [Candidatus Omnitrophota bacterium]